MTKPQQVLYKTAAAADYVAANRPAVLHTFLQPEYKQWNECYVASSAS